MTHDGHERAPAFGVFDVDVELERQIDPQDARKHLDPFDVAVQPEAGLRNPGDHSLSLSSTQVSFEPPPWLELTT